MSAPEPPPGYRFDPFADVRQGRSLFELRDMEDWLVRDEPERSPARTALQSKTGEVK